MYYCEAPEDLSFGLSVPRVFMAGGITGCPDWQREMRDRLINTNIALYNPRRANFPIGDSNAAEAQIAWEHQQLQRAKAILFWFPCETICPIVLFELGAWSHWRWPNGDGRGTMMTKPLFVGVHPEYQRKQDVIIQMKLERPDVEVVESLADLSHQVIKWSAEKAKA